MTPDRHGRVLRLPGRGTLLVSTDMHGNGADLLAMVKRFEESLHVDPATYWLVLGDAVHGPDPSSRLRCPDLYDFPDESWAIVATLAGLRKQHPERFHYLLGNHDYGHIGGAHTRKFYHDEVEHLESSLTPTQVEILRHLFREAPLAAVAPCGLLLCHGSPDDSLRRLADLEALSLPPDPTSDYHRRLVDEFLRSYGQPGAVTERLLRTVSAGCGMDLHIVAHGHDRDEAGWYAEEGNQVCPVLFGAPRAEKRYLRIDLASTYRSVDYLRDGVEIRRLHPR